MFLPLFAAAGETAAEYDASTAKAVRCNPYQDSGTYINIELRLACSLSYAMEKRRAIAIGSGGDANTDTGKEAATRSTSSGGDRFNRMLFVFRYGISICEMFTTHALL